MENKWYCEICHQYKSMEVEAFENKYGDGKLWCEDCWENQPIPDIDEMKED